MAFPKSQNFHPWNPDKFVNGKAVESQDCVCNYDRIGRTVDVLEGELALIL
jgi:hypothetical protein